MSSTTVTCRVDAFVRDVLEDHAQDRDRSLSEESRIILEIGAFAIMIRQLLRPSVADALGTRSEQLRDQILADFRAKWVELLPDSVPLAIPIDPDKPDLSMN